MPSRSEEPSVPSAIAEALAAVEPPDRSWADRASDRQSRLTMPAGSLGRLLELGRQLAAVQRTDRPFGHPALIAVFAADHGVAAEGVSAYPAEVTGQMVTNYLRGGAAINVLARRAGAEVRVVDLGVATPPGSGTTQGLLARSVRRGTSNFLRGAAMSRAEAFQAFTAGLDLGEQWVLRDGFRVIGLGEMGIGNTTAASALIVTLTGAPAEGVVGRGTGVDVATLRAKTRVVAASVERHRVEVVDVWDWLARLGGFEIIGLAGLAIAAARAHALIVLDGLISSTAGMIAARLCPRALGSFVAAHVGPEPGHKVVLDDLGLKPLLELGLRLGEGTGAALALPLIAASADILRDMATFDEAGVSGRVV